MPPGPSEPASIPIKRNNRRAGIPSLIEALLATILKNKRMEVTKSMYSMESIVLFYYLVRILTYKFRFFTPYNKIQDNDKAKRQKIMLPKLTLVYKPALETVLF